MLYNLQKPRTWKRITAALLDGIMLLVLALMCMLIVADVMNYSARSANLETFYTRYSEEYNVDFDRAVNDYESLTEEEIARVDEAYAALGADEEAMAAYEDMLRLTMTIIAIGVLLAFALLEFGVALLLGNGQTIGKKLLGIGVMQQDGTEITTTILVARTFVGKYIIEIMLPVLLFMMMSFGALGILAPVIILVLLVAEIVLFVKSRYKALIHDQICSTVCVDINNQRIISNRPLRTAPARKPKAPARKPKAPDKGPRTLN